MFYRRKVSSEQIFQRTAVADSSRFAKHWHELKALNSQLIVGIVEPGNGCAKPESLTISVASCAATNNMLPHFAKVANGSFANNASTFYGSKRPCTSQNDRGITREN